VIEYRLGPADLASVRFARSPMLELACSVQVLTGTTGQTMHLPWLAATRPRLAGVSLELLPALLGNPARLPDFLLPKVADIAEALEVVRGHDGDAVRADLDEVFPVLPTSLRPLYDAPERCLGQVADELVAYWEAAINPVWQRLCALYAADLEHRTAALTAGGVTRLLSTLHPEIRYSGEWLRIRKPLVHHRQVLGGTGILLVPCVFAWPRPLASTRPDCQPTITYVPRGIGQIWLSSTASAPLGELLGHSRAALLAHLDLPLSTTQLAANLGMSAPTISQHLSVLLRTGLVRRRRTGRIVLYQRTSLATRLLRPGSDDNHEIGFPRPKPRRSP